MGADALPEVQLVAVREADMLKPPNASWSCMLAMMPVSTFAGFASAPFTLGWCALFQTVSRWNFVAQRTCCKPAHCWRPTMTSVFAESAAPRGLVVLHSYHGHDEPVDLMLTDR